MTTRSDQDRSGTPDEVDEQLDELAEDLRRPHDDEEERRRRAAAAEEAGANPRREGKG